jgi:hypothetical protein
MKTGFGQPRTRKAAKALHVLKAMFDAKPKKARKAGRKAAKEFDRLHPKPRKKGSGDLPRAFA